VSPWQFWLLVAVLLVIILLAGFAVLFLVGAVTVSAREAAGERERGTEA
jgi:hypothetical protein